MRTKRQLEAEDRAAKKREDKLAKVRAEAGETWGLSPKDRGAYRIEAPKPIRYSKDKIYGIVHSFSSNRKDRRVANRGR